MAILFKKKSSNTERIFLNQKGTSLIEMMIAISVFVVLMAAATSIFRATLETQRSAIAGQNTQENLRYLFEIMSKELRNAQLMENDCDTALDIISDKELYYFDGVSLHFLNKDGYCVKYSIDANDSMLIKRVEQAYTTNVVELPVTPNVISVVDFEFFVNDNNIGTPPVSRIQPRVTFLLGVEMKTSQSEHRQHTVMQTTISARSYR